MHGLVGPVHRPHAPIETAAQHPIQACYTLAYLLRRGVGKVEPHGVLPSSLGGPEPMNFLTFYYDFYYEVPG
jgi:hypothetical protein